MNARIVCHFSCGAASAVATKLGAYFFRDRKTGERWPLTALPQHSAPIDSVEVPECSIFCAMAEEEIEP